MLTPDKPLAFAQQSAFPAEGRPPVLARSLLLGHRIDTAGLESRVLLSSTPPAFEVGEAGYAAVFR